MDRTFNLSSLKTLLVSLLVIFSIKIVLEYLYTQFVFANYSYDGFSYDINSMKYIWSWVYAFLVYGLLYSKRNLNISELYLLLYLIYFLPNVIYYGLTNQATTRLFYLTLPYVFIVMFTFDRQLLKVKSFAKSKVYLIIVSYLALFAVLIHYYISSGGSFVLSFEEVYDFREKFAQSDESSFWGYLNGWVNNIFSIIIFAWSLQKKKKVLFAVNFVLIVLLFALSGHKSILSSLIVILFFYSLFQKNNRHLYLLIGFSILVLTALMFVVFFQDNAMLPSLLIRRLLFLPSQINYLYIEFFNNHELMYWSNSFLSSFFKNPYSQDLSFIIGSYMGHNNMSANTGFIASGFAHAGLAGVMLYTFIVLLIMNYINQLGYKNEKYLTASLSFKGIVVALFWSSDLLVSLFTHGVLLLLIVLIVYNDKKYILRFGRFRYEI